MSIPDTPKDKIRSIAKKCMEANPAKICTMCRGHGIYKRTGNYCISCGGRGTRVIRLADVLLAIGKKSGNVNVTSLGWMRDYDTDDEAPWNLRRDSLYDQDDTCINFLHSLLSSQ